MNATKVNDAVGRESAGKPPRGTARGVLRSFLILLQFIGFLSTITFLIMTGPSVWTLLVGIASAVVTKASLSMMDPQPDLDVDSESLSQLAEFVLNNPMRRR
jgi:hypothetical protein